MSSLALSGLSFGYSSPPLLENVSLNIAHGERVGLLGRNGAGKSTLLRLLAGELTPESGTLRFEPGARIAYLTQEVPSGLGGSIFDRVADGLGPAGGALALYHRLHRQTLTEADQVRLEEAVARLGENGGWEQLHRIERTLVEMQLDGDQLFDTLSAGRKRRVLLARAIVGKPDVLLLDEPTNHLDIDAIVWLQGFLLGYGGTVIFITHDRAFLQALATRIVELDRGRLFDFETDYETFLSRRDELLEAEARQQAQFDKKLAEEERWVRQGVKARRKRNEGRKRALIAMREERRRRRSEVGTVRFSAPEATRSGQRVVKADAVTFAYGERAIIREFSTEIGRGDRIGLIGPNGAGKTTLLRILLGELEPRSGTVQLGTRRQVAYFDQLRAQLDESKTVLESIAGGQEVLEINGQPRHLLGYLQDFLFTPERARMRVGMLSGGERNRLLLARLFTKPSNVLVLDEPTNDLDAETLELLEELLADYPGTVLLVSHDRAFLNNVVTSTIVVDPDGSVKEYAGGYDDYLQQRPAAPRAEARSAPPAEAPAVVPPAPRKLSFKEQRELEGLPKQIEDLEARQRELHERMAEPGWHRQGAERLSAATSELEQIERDLAAAYARWEALELVASRG